MNEAKTNEQSDAEARNVLIAVEGMRVPMPILMRACAARIHGGLLGTMPNAVQVIMLGMEDVEYDTAKLVITWLVRAAEEKGWVYIGAGDHNKDGVLVINTVVATKADVTLANDKIYELLQRGNDGWRFLSAAEVEAAMVARGDTGGIGGIAASPSRGSVH